MVGTRLVGDVGGTNARFALVDEGGVPRHERKLAVADHAGLVEAALAYLDGRSVAEAVIAVATPVEGDAISFTNSPWRFSITAARDALGLERIAVVNDFVAQAEAVPRLAADDLRKLGGGDAAPDRPIAVLGPGTGLGMAALLPGRRGWRPLPSEGGHASFAPANELEDGILGVLRRRFGHVSYERVLSGPGLVNLALALAELRGGTLDLTTPKEVATRAAAGGCEVCESALRVFAHVLGGAAGNLALTLLARGGVYIAGGLCRNLGPQLDADGFRERFVDKGRFRDYLEPIPTLAVMRAHTGLLGAAAHVFEEEV